MTLLPIVERELRVAARRRGTYWTRAAIVMVATILAMVSFLASLVIPVAKFGQILFWGLSGMSMLYCLIAGRLLTADCLSEEKREGTFGLLFLTDLKGYDVVLGKLAAKSFNGFYGLLATVPVLAIPLMVGGMTYGEFWRMVVVLVDTFLFTLAIGIFASAISRDYQHAMGRNFALLLVTTALLPACAGALYVLKPAMPLQTELLLPCPVYTFVLCSDSMYTKAPLLFWSSAGVIHCMTWMLIFLACRLAPRSWQDKPVPPRPEAGQRRQRWQWWREGSAAKQNAFRKRLLDRNAYYWLAGRPHVKPAWVWTLLVLVVCWMVRTTLAVGRLEATVCVTGALLLNSTLKLWIALEAGQQLAADQKGGAFELLLSTPLTAGDILRGQFLALTRQFLKPLLVVIVAEFLCMLVLAQPAYRWARLDPTGAQEAWGWAAGILMLAADAAALSVVAMASALTAKSYAQASMRTVRCILVVPWVLYGLAYLIVNLFLEWWPNWTSYLSWEYQLATWFGLGILIDIGFGWTAWHRLRTDFRSLALRSYGPPSSGFFALLRRRIKSAIEAIWARPGGADQGPPRARLKKRFVAGAALSLCVCFYLINRASSVQFPPPVAVSLGRTNTALRISSGGDGAMFVLPDGSLWRWGKMAGAHYPRAAVPQSVGTNSDWVEISTFGHTIGLRGDGTVWEWDSNSDLPHPAAPGHDWVQVTSGYNFSVIRKRDGTLWAWGDNAKGQLGNGPASPGNLRLRTWPPKSTWTPLVQIGTNTDWIAVCANVTSTLAIRQDGTMWTWGDIVFLSGQSSSAISYPFPIQVCRETNWISLSAGRETSARNQAGELWDIRFLTAAPSPTAPASSLFNRIDSRSASADPAFGVDYGLRPTAVRYEVRSDGTLWAAPVKWPITNPAAQDWKKIGRRHDWISVWGDFNTVFALTADGTLWTWGLDSSHDPSPRRQSGLQVLRARVAQMFGGPGAGNSFAPLYAIQKKPRPLLRLIPGASIPTNSAAAGPIH
jgi:ABC-type transport system involved in multi-copper enzyme maturation permease subunit